ncbi:MAG: hypothetical protein HY743_10600 [Deltaproteobacteria bacterium]|nr:hypothetical protein [Deltaproteobacteria bacterium]
MTEDASFDHLNDVLKRFIARANEELSLRWNQWKIDLSHNEFHEVAGSLLARQVTLATQIAMNPQIWNGDVAPIILRAMADVYITLAWVLRDPINRSKQFIHYGLGQEKLQLEHRRADIDGREPMEGELDYIKSIENWINSQRAIFLTDVNVGSWSGISTRKMAEEAECLDFYNYVYTPFSACAHSMWHHVARYNLMQCQNPLHQLHGVPYVPDHFIDPYYMYLGAKYLQKTFSTFDMATSISIEGHSAYDLLYDGFYTDTPDETEKDESKK